MAITTVIIGNIIMNRYNKNKNNINGIKYLFCHIFIYKGTKYQNYFYILSLLMKNQ